ncbi:MAG: putative lipoate-protein ligase [Planctomycetota bacterium]
MVEGERTSASTAGPLRPTWLDCRLSTVEEHLALDEALLDMAHEGESRMTCVRSWMAAEPVVVLGSSSRCAEEVDFEACRRHGVRVVRRPSGGATVVLGPGCVMWSVIEHHPQGPPPIEAIHAAMLEPLAAALNEALARAGRAEGGRVARRGTSDLALLAGGGASQPDLPVAPADDLKVSGNALRVRRHGVLYHGTLLDTFDLDLVGRVLKHPPREPEYRGRRPHAAFLANLGLGRAVLETAIRTAFGAVEPAGDWPADRVARLVRDRYAAADWTERL